MWWPYNNGPTKFVKVKADARCLKDVFIGHAVIYTVGSSDVYLEILIEEKFYFEIKATIHVLLLNCMNLSTFIFIFLSLIFNLIDKIFKIENTNNNLLLLVAVSSIEMRYLVILQDIMPFWL